MIIASIGPTTSEALEEFDITADIVPTHPKMGFLVKETAEQANAVIERKRASHAER
jgi:uroporphyrinogen-III synthase